ncbi:CvpA family protein [candidate division KSB1 bacterium]
MNYLDIFIIIVVGLLSFWGINKGLVKALAGIVGFLAALMIATGFVGVLADKLQDVMGLSNAASYVLAYVVLFFSIILIFKISAHLITKLFEVSSLRWVDRTGGGAFGFMIGGLILSFLFTALSFFSFTDKMLPERENSFLYPYARDFYPAIYNVVSKISPASKTFQDISAEILKEHPRETLMRTEAGRKVLEYLEGRK